MDELNQMDERIAEIIERTGVAIAHDLILIESKPLVLKDDPSLTFNGFLYLGSLQPNFINRDSTTGKVKMPKDLKTLPGSQYLDVAQKLAASNPSAIIQMTKRAIDSNLLPSNDQYLWFLARFLKDVKSEDLSKEIRANFLNFVRTSDDLLFLLKHFQTKLSFSASMRKCLTQWYDQRSPTELLEILFTSPNNEHARHIDIIKLLHLRLENTDKAEIIKACFMTYKEIKEGAKDSATLKKILKYKDLKRCREAHEVVSILKRKDFTYKLNHLPPFALKHAEIVEQIIPNLSLKEILGLLPIFYKRRFVAAEHPLARKICNAIKFNNKAIKENKLNPLYVFWILKTQEHYVTGPDRIKSDKVDGPPGNTFINAKLMSIINMSFTERAKTGCRYYMTIDLRKFSKDQRFIEGMMNVRCFEAQIITALTYLKSEKNVTLMTFTEDRNELKPVSWTAQTTYEQAVESYKKDEKVTKENVALPLKSAMIDKKQVDVFITFVSSVRRTMGRNSSPPFEQLKAYREAMKLPKAKLVVINLTKTTPDFVYTESNINESGFLEIAGIGPDSFKLIDAFSKNCFD